MTDSDSVADERFMQVAIELAAQGQGSVEPNPMVGCVIVRDGEITGRGFHAKFGGPHAEVVALESLTSRQHARGATAYVTLEPCCHHGKTPPCSQALIDAGIARVVVAMADPFPQVNGGGLQQLRDAAIITTVGVLRDQSASLNAPYLKRVQTGLPYVIAKWAMTADGRIATATGESKWITGPTSRSQVHRLRGRVDAIITGMGTVEADDPLLTARPPGPRTATRVIFCRHRLPALQSKLIQTVDVAPVLLITAKSFEDAGLDLLRQRGVEVYGCDTDDASEMTLAALAQLASNGATNVMLECGGQLLSSFLATDQLDECHVYVGPKLFGGKTSAGPIGGEGVLSIDQALRLKLLSTERFNDDLLAIYRRDA